MRVTRTAAAAAAKSNNASNSKTATVWIDAACHSQRCICQCALALHCMCFCINWMPNLAIDTNTATCHIKHIQTKLTVQELGASIKAFFVLLALLGRRFEVRQCGGEQTCARLYQEFHHAQIVATGCTMQRRPTVRVLSINIAAIFDEESNFTKINTTTFYANYSCLCVHCISTTADEYSLALSFTHTHTLTSSLWLLINLPWTLNIFTVNHPFVSLRHARL